jgi:nicotinate-nucleotide pyrophosphorylase (carboxylating)
MTNLLNSKALAKFIESFYEEDMIYNNFYYLNSLPEDLVKCRLNFKQDLIVAGLPFFVEAFKFLGASEESFSSLLNEEGKKKSQGDFFEFELPFSIAITGERVGLNLLQKASSVSTFTNLFVEKAKNYSTEILDTRKTTPGLRFLEKYAVRLGGASNHRFSQTDVWMVKDNHKKFFNGLKNAVQFFKDQKEFYKPIQVEIHDLLELEIALELKINHVMLDNFSPKDIKTALEMKKHWVTYEVSGGINLENIEGYLMEGIDAISIGSLTYGAPPVDISLKMER